MDGKYQLILEIDRLKTVFRQTVTLKNRYESTAEHSWSVCMIIMILFDELQREFTELNALKLLQLGLVHDLVEIYAGDANAFDLKARKAQEAVEREALQQLIELEPVFGKKLYDLWYEFEGKVSIEAKIAKAADAICPIFQRLYARQSYVSMNVNLEDLEKVKYPRFKFSQTFMQLFERLKTDLLHFKLILRA